MSLQSFVSTPWGSDFGKTPEIVYSIMFTVVIEQMDEEAYNKLESDDYEYDESDWYNLDETSKYLNDIEFVETFINPDVKELDVFKESVIRDKYKYVVSVSYDYDLRNVNNNSLGIYSVNNNNKEIVERLDAIIRGLHDC